MSRGDKMLSESQKKAVAKYNAKAYDEIKVRVKKGSKQIIEEAAKANNESVNGYIKTAVKLKIKADTGSEADL